MTLPAPRPIEAEDDTHAFDCGQKPLNDRLRQRAVANEASRASRTYVVCDGRTVAGYYCLAAGGIASSEAPGAIRRNMPDPIPVMLLGRLAVDRRWQGQGIGRGLMRDAAFRTEKAARIAGIRALLVHALDDDAVAFYRRLGFHPSPGNPRSLLIRLDLAWKSWAGKSS